MAVNFPDSPTLNDTFTSGTRTYVYDGTSWRLQSSTTAVPSDLDLLDLGINDGTDGQVLTTNGAGAFSFADTTGGVAVYTNFSDLPVAGNTAGDQAFVSSTRRLYIWDGVGWFGVALINQAPVVSGNAASYLVSDGVPIEVTMIATDPEGDVITWSSEITGDNTITVTNANNVFTISNTIPFSAGSGTIIFKANDGYNLATAVSEFQMELPDLAYLSTKNPTETEPTWTSDGDTVWFYTADNYTLTFGRPATVDIDVWGGGGGGGASWSGSTQKGGSGGYHFARNLELPAGTYTLVVGAGGRGGIFNNGEPQAVMDANNEDFGNGGLGTAGAYSGTGNNNGGCGGGFSGLFASQTLSQANAIIIAGGGGGGSASSGFDGGSGGGDVAINGESVAVTPVASQSAGGVGENGAESGSELQGGNGIIGYGFGGGGGGGGYWGGGAVGLNASSGTGGGGGGSGHVSSSYVNTGTGFDTATVRQFPTTVPTSFVGAPTEVTNSAQGGSTSTTQSVVDGKDGAIRLVLRALG